MFDLTLFESLFVLVLSISVVVVMILSAMLSIRHIRYTDSARVAFDQARLDYVSGLHALPTVITDAIHKDTNLTETNKELLAKIVFLEDSITLKDKLIDEISKEFTTVSDASFELLNAKDAIINKLEAFVAAVPTTSVNSPLSDIREAIEGVLDGFGAPTNVYETGVYNGFVVVANTLFEGAGFELHTLPTVSSSSSNGVKHNLRGVNGKFVKRV